MNGMLWFAGAITLVLVAYLTVALLKPEQFS